MKSKIKNHYATVLNQTSSENQVKVFSESSRLTNKYNYSFTNPECCPAPRTSRSNTVSGSDGIPTLEQQPCELEDVLDVLKSHLILSDNRNTSQTNENIALSSPDRERAIHHLLKTTLTYAVLSMNMPTNVSVKMTQAHN